LLWCAGFWGVMRTYVAEFMDIVYPLEKGQTAATAPVPQDPELRRFVDSLGRSLSPIDPQLKRFSVPTRDRLIDVITHLMCNGSAWHEHVGSVAEYTIDPKFIGVRLLPIPDGEKENEEPMSGVQAYTLSLALTMLTGLKMPSIIDDWSHLSFLRVRRSLLSVSLIISLVTAAGCSRRTQQLRLWLWLPLGRARSE
jgi:hypothetical protein